MPGWVRGGRVTEFLPFDPGRHGNTNSRLFNHPRYGTKPLAGFMKC